VSNNVELHILLAFEIGFFNLCNEALQVDSVEDIIPSPVVVKDEEVCSSQYFGIFLLSELLQVSVFVIDDFDVGIFITAIVDEGIEKILIDVDL
jgi:hypothetical protein